MQFSDAEWKIMNVLWTRDRATARDVLEALSETAWAYTTVKTLLTRLVEKGALREAKQGNTSVYRTVVNRNKARGKALRALIDKAFDGAFAPLMAHLVDHEKLSPRDRRRLQELLDADGDQ